jgi:hypothetical protein
MEAIRKTEIKIIHFHELDPVSLTSFKHYKIRIISTGDIVVTAKRADGKIDVFAVEEVAKRLQDGSLTITGKKGKVKEIAKVTVVSDAILKTLLAAIVEQVHDVALPALKADKAASKVTSAAETKKSWISGYTEGFKTALLSAFTPERAVQYVIEESYRIKERILKKEQQALEEEQEVIRQDVKRSELKRDYLKQEMRLKHII